MKNKISSLIMVVALFSSITAFGQTDKNTKQNQNQKATMQNDKAMGQNQMKTDQMDKLWPLSTTSEEAKASFAQALDRLWNGRMDEYQKKIDEAINADPNFFLAQANSAIVQYIDDKDKAQKLIDKALAIPQNNLTPPEKSVRKMLTDLKDNKTENVRSTIDEIINAYPETDQSYQFAMGMSRFILDDKDLSFKYAQMAVDKFPDDAPAWNQLGYHYMDNDQMDKAEEAFNNYLRLRPDEANAHDSYADFCMKKGNYDEARRHYETAVQMGMTASRERAEKARVMAQGGGEPDND